MTMKGGTSLRLEGVSKSLAAFSMMTQTINGVRNRPSIAVFGGLLAGITGALGDVIQHRKS
jgi:hypothetical protein